MNALESIARFQNQKVDGGTRKQIIATVQQLWNKSKSDLELAKTTYNRIEVLYRDSVVSSQRRDEVKALYDAAVAGERAAWNQYQMALDGAQIQDRESARSLVNAAKGTVPFAGRPLDSPGIRPDIDNLPEKGRAGRSRDAYHELDRA